MNYFATHLFTGFPWLLLGYSVTPAPLIGLAPLIGVFGLSLAAAFIGASLTLLSQRSSYSIKLICVMIIAGLFISGWIFQGHTYTKPHGSKITVSLIQGNISPQLKWSASQLKKSISIYTDLTKKHLSSQLIVWPESAITAYPFTLPNYYHQLQQLIINNNTTLILGAPTFNQKTRQSYNSLLMINKQIQQYNKHHLVPFGEYTPLPAIFGIIFNSLNIPMSHFSAGKGLSQLSFNNINIAPFICYEIAFPNEVLTHTRNKQLIITISDDAWFGKTIALPQHLQMAQMRALETQRPVLLDSNTGITAFISPHGVITAAKPFIQTVLTKTIQPTYGNTPLMQVGYYPVWLMCLILLLIGFFYKRRQ